MSKDTIKRIGDIITITLPLITAIVLTICNCCRDLILFVIIYIMGNLTCQFIKGICDSERPREGGKYEIIKIHGYSHNDGESCCSGHAMSAALPTYFLLLSGNFWYFIPAFVLSCICAWTRVKVKAHWVFDVVLSNIIALLVNISIIYVVIQIRRL